MQPSPRRKWTTMETIAAVSPRCQSFVNIAITGSGVIYRHDPAGPDGAQRAHARGAAAGGAGAVPRPGRRGHLRRADRGGRRGVAAHVLSTLLLQARLAVRRLHRIALVSRGTGRSTGRGIDHRLGAGSDLRIP